MFSVIIFRLGAGPRLASAVGKDEQGRGLLSGEELDTSLVRNGIGNIRTRKQHIAQVRIVADARTAAYTALLDAKGECQLGIGDMDIHAQISPDYVKTLEKEIISAPLVVADGNMPQKSLLALMELCHKHRGAFEQIIYK